MSRRVAHFRTGRHGLHVQRMDGLGNEGKGSLARISHCHELAQHQHDETQADHPEPLIFLHGSQYSKIRPV